MNVSQANDIILKGVSEYEAQAMRFLSRNQITCRIALSDTKAANWEPSGHHYRVTLSGRRRRIVFDFWGSAHDMHEGKTPTDYDVLACISGDANCPDTFAEFCSEYGYEADSIKALQTFRRCSRFTARLQAFFSAEEIIELQEIN